MFREHQNRKNDSLSLSVMAVAQRFQEIREPGLKIIWNEGTKGK